MAGRSAGRALRALLQPPARAAPLTPRGPAASYGTSITSAKIQVNGVHLHYQQTGEGNHAVLLLPGMLVLKDQSSDLLAVHGRLSVGLLLRSELGSRLTELQDE